MFIDMLSQPDFASYNLSNLRGGVIAGSTVPPEVMKKIIKNMNMREIVVSLFPSLGYTLCFGVKD
ncbi:hypothetical protein JD844_011524, partial [Phrynosoma platyrhinos]